MTQPLVRKLSVHSKIFSTVFASLLLSQGIYSSPVEAKWWDSSSKKSAQSKSDQDSDDTDKQPASETPFYSKATVPKELMDCGSTASTVNLISTKFAPQVYSTIQKAIAAARVGDLVLIGKGSWNESLYIDRKLGISIVSLCQAQVKNIVIKKNFDLTIDGLEVTGAKNGIAGIRIGKSDDDNDGDSENHQTDKDDGDHSRPWWSQYQKTFEQSPSQIVIKNTNVHDINGNGIFFAKSIRPSAIFVIDSAKINYNKQNGLVLANKGQYTLTNLLIDQNSGYGIKVPFSDDHKFSAILKNSAIIYNNGVLQYSNSEDDDKGDDKNKKDTKVLISTHDISNFARLVTSADIGNFTTEGIENTSSAPSAVAKFQPVPPKITVLNTNLLTITNKKAWTIQVSIEEHAPFTTAVYQNGKLIYSSTALSFLFPVTLTEGLNDIQIVSANIINQSTTYNIPTITLDTVPPKLAQSTPVDGAIFYTNKLPYSLSVDAIFNKTLSNGSVNGVPVSVLGLRGLSSQLIVSMDGPQNITYVATDLAGNVTTINQTVNLVYSTVLPKISLSATDGQYTNKTSFPLTINVQDPVPTNTTVYLNGVQVYQTSRFTDTVNLNLQQGSNSVIVASMDLAGNSAIPTQVNLILDTTPPKLTSISPVHGSYVESMMFPIAGGADKKLSAATVNGMRFNIADTQFSGTYVATQLGALPLNVSITDLAGNVTNFSVTTTVLKPLLVPSLVSAAGDRDGIHMWIIGAASAARPGAALRAYESFFGNSGTATANADGSFQIKLDQFTSATLTATDSQWNETKQMTVSFTGTTRIAGSVQDVFGNPLPNATIGITNSKQTVVTDSKGNFVFDAPPTGDQTLSIDGSTIPQTTTGPQKTYSVTHVAVNIGLGQNNVLESPVFMTPMMLDGSQTPVTTAGSVTVTSTYAPGVQLSISGGTTMFPNGSTTGAINVMAVPSNRATTPVPSMFVPTQVISLEPSGTHFSQPVALSVPNDNFYKSPTDDHRWCGTSINSGYKWKWEHHCLYSRLYGTYLDSCGCHGE